MPRTPDEHPGSLIETETIDLDSYSGELTSTGQIAFQDGYIKIKDDYGVVQIRHNEITKDEHDKLYTLIHFIDDGPTSNFGSELYKEITYLNNVFPSTIVWWESELKLKKIIEKIITRNSNQLPTEVIYNMYDSNGNIVETARDVFTYNGVFETSKKRYSS